MQRFGNGENHMKIGHFLLPFLAVICILTGCTKTVYETRYIDNTVIPEMVTNNLDFRAFTRVANNSSTSNPSFIPPGEPSSPLPGVSILIIGTDGKVIDKLVTNEQGEAQKSITVPVDYKYPEKPVSEVATLPRGTVTVIAFKEGYRQTVLFEVPIDSSAQPFLMEPIVAGESNDPDVQLGNNRHLEIISLVEKYKGLISPESKMRY
jgi:hypothetical protein